MRYMENTPSEVLHCQFRVLAELHTKRQYLQKPQIIN
jgi:hypothetical protein